MSRPFRSLDSRKLFLFWVGFVLRINFSIWNIVLKFFCNSAFKKKNRDKFVICAKRDFMKSSTLFWTPLNFMNLKHNFYVSYVLVNLSQESCNAIQPHETPPLRSDKQFRLHLDRNASALHANKMYQTRDPAWLNWLQVSKYNFIILILVLHWHHKLEAFFFV